MIFGIALISIVLLATAIVRAIPPDPTEGELEDEKIVGDWNWQVGAYVWGHWIWILGNPGTHKFDEEIWEGWRHASYGVSVQGTLNFTWGYDNSNWTERQDVLYIGHQMYVNCDRVYARANTTFCNIWGQSWDADSGLAEIRI
jgi:hypothetical protein